MFRYQTAINRQLTKAIEQLEDVQAERNAAAGTTDHGSGPASGIVAEEPCDLPLEPGSGDAGQLIPAALNPPAAGPLTADSACEAIARQPFVPALGEVSSGLAKTSSGAPQKTEIYGTKPPKPNSSGEAERPGDEEAGEVHSLAEIIERVAGLAAHAEPNDGAAPTSGHGNKSPYAAAPPEPSQEDIFDCL